MSPSERVGMKSGGRVRELARRLWREHSSPVRLGLAVALGIVVGCSPFFGLHFWIGLGLALLLRLNKVAVFLGSQISIPPLAPLIGFASVQVGALILSGDMVCLRVTDFQLGRLWGLLRQFLLYWTVGGLVVGVALALPAFLVTALAVRLRRGTGQQQDVWAELVQAASSRYRDSPRAHRHYARFKYRMDPLYRQVCDLLGVRRVVVDLGTGLGMLPVLVALRGQADRVVGVEWDAGKVRSGRRAVAGLPRVELVHQDIRDYRFDEEGVDAVVLADVLHYWSVAEQRKMLRRAAGSLRPGGRLIVRETDREARSWLTRLLEALAVRVGWNRGPGLSYRTADELQQELELLGLQLAAETAASSSRIHRGNVLIWADRPAE